MRYGRLDDKGVLVRDTVAAYLDAEAETLPKIAVRETRTKMLTGRK